MPTVSWSRIKTWRRCHKAYDYKYNQNLVRKAPIAPLLRGSLIHEMLDARARNGNPMGIWQAYEKKFRNLFTEEQETYGNLLEDALRVYESYCRYYEHEDLKPVRTEYFIATSIRDDIRFIGYIDKVVEDKRGQWWIMDHKTHKNLPNEEARFSDLQLLFYVWAWNRENKSTPVTGVIWDYLRTKPPTIPETLSKGGLTKRENLDTDYYTYLSEIKTQGLDPKDYKDVLDRLKNKPSKSFARVMLPIPPTSMVETVVEDVKNTALEIMYLGRTSSVRNLSRDCAQCQFYNLCHAELRGQDSDFVKKSQYAVQEPSEHGEEDTITE